MNKKWLIITVAIVLIAVLGLVLYQNLWGVSANTEAQVTSTVAVTRGTIEETVSATGTVVAKSQANLVFESSGRIDEVLVEKGDRVEDGEVLSRLDLSALEEQIARAEASLGTTRARLEQAKRPASEAELASAQAAVDSAKASLARLVAGSTEEDIRNAQLSIDTARNQLWGAQAQRDSIKGDPRQSAGAKSSAEAQVLSAEVAVEQALLAQERMLKPPAEEDLTIGLSQVAQAEAQLAQMLDRPRVEDVALAQAQVDEAALALAQTQARLEDAMLCAPFDGTVLVVSISAGEWASPGVPAIVMADTDELMLDVNVDELDVAQIAEGQTARLTFESLPRQEVVGTVTRISPSATSVGGAVAYQVETRFALGDLPVRIGMTANVDIVTDKAEDALLVANRAITADRAAGRYYVRRQDSHGNTERIKVEIGLRDDNFTQVVSGLNEGDTVVLTQIVGQNEDAFEGPMGGLFGGMRGAMR